MKMAAVCIGNGYRPIPAYLQLVFVLCALFVTINKFGPYMI